VSFVETGSWADTTVQPAKTDTNNRI
jgi:hypothetical protein